MGLSFRRGKLIYQLVTFLSTMRLDNPLDDLFKTASSIRVLRALVGLPSGFGVSAREIARRAGVTHPTASKLLSSLVEQGLASVRRTPRGDEFAMNGGHVLGQQVIDLFERERELKEGLLRFLGDAIRHNAPWVQEAFLYGSAAWGEMTPRSDLDVAVTCSPATRLQVESGMQKVAADVQARYGNRLSALVGDPFSLLLDAFGRKKKSRDRRSAPAIWDRIYKEGIRIPLRGKGGSVR
jgi:predicted nucleotidyltransferase